MLPRVLGQLFERSDTRTARLIDQTIVEENLLPHHVAFFAAQLVVDSDALAFIAEPWSPEHIPHQRLYDSPIFGNTHPDDQELYRQRGWGRLVGRAVYHQFSCWSGVDCISEPDHLLEMGLSYRSWIWLWHKRQGRRCADLARTNFASATTEFIGWPDRIPQRFACWQRNMQQLHNQQGHIHVNRTSWS